MRSHGLHRDVRWKAARLADIGREGNYGISTMNDRDDQPADDAEPPAHNAQLAGYGYLIFLGLVLTGLAIWFVLTRTSAHPMS